LPWYVPRDYFDMYPPGDITPPPVKDDDLDDVPAAGRLIAEQRRGDLELVRRSGQYQRILQAYLASVTFCDAMVGRLVHALDASPAATRTIIVFWSDNGWHFGEKSHLHKMTLWARSTRLPLIVAAPSVTRGGSRTSRAVSLVDLFPTLTDLCDLPQPKTLEGTSLVPLMEDPNRTWDRLALITYLQGNHAVCDERWRYIRYADGGEELYDHRSDPNEWTNLADRPELAAVKANLARGLPESDAPSLRGKRRRPRQP
jgi:arylsulfatase A-like enzyme